MKIFLEYKFLSKNWMMYFFEMLAIKSKTRGSMCTCLIKNIIYMYVIENCHDCIPLLTMSYLSCCRWPLIIDRSSQAATFLRYRDTNYLNALNTKEMEPNKVRLSLLGAIRLTRFLHSFIQNSYACSNGATFWFIFYCSWNIVSCFNNSPSGWWFYSGCIFALSTIIFCYMIRSIRIVILPVDLENHWF